MFIAGLTMLVIATLGRQYFGMGGGGFGLLFSQWHLDIWPLFAVIIVVARFYFKFVAAGAIAGGISTIVLIFSAEWLPIWLAKVIAIGASFVVNYFIADRYVFPGEE